MSIFQTLFIVAAFATLIGCQPEESDAEFMDDELDMVAESVHTANDTTVFELDLDSLFATYGVKGSILIETDDDDTLWQYNAERLDIGYSPASTFKVVNSLIALEEGIVNREDTLFHWDGKPRRLKSWEADMTLVDAFRTSCVPCYQEIARKIGTERMNAYLAEFDYGNMVVTEKNIDKFWLEGPSTITSRQQMKFLQKLVDGELSVSSDATGELTEVMKLVENPDYTLYGKTGWSIRGRKDIGWFIGWYESGNRNLLFVTNVEPLKGRANESFAKSRHQITKRVMEIIGAFSN